MARAACLLTLVVCACALAASAARATTPPQIDATYVTEVTASSARLRAEINPEGESTTYRFEYLTLAQYEANLKAAKEPFAGANKAPLSGGASVGSGTGDVAVAQHVSGLLPSTLYRFRAVATNPTGTTIGPERGLGTEPPTNAFELLDGRGWEMVSPVDKNGGQIPAPEASFGGGAFQAAEDGLSLTFSSPDSFAGGAGAPPASQYIATRTTSGWSTQNITTPLSSGGYGDEPNGVPYRLFSEDLARGLLLDPAPCAEAAGCPRSYSLRESASETLTSTPEAEGLAFEGASPDLRHLVFSSPEGLYEWSGEEGFEQLSAVSGARLAAPSGAISKDGSHVYFTTPEEGAIHLATEGEEKLLAESSGGGAAFQIASADGSIAFFTKAGRIWRFDAQSETFESIATEVKGVLGASGDGSVLYYQDGVGLFAWREGEVEEVAAGKSAAAPSDYPPSTATARVSQDGEHLLFLSSADLSGYEANGQSEAFLYGPPPDGGKARLACVSCNPTGERAQGPSTIAAAIANGSTRAYRPRALSASGNRAFFESDDRLSPQDSNKATDVYEWEAQGEGDCSREGGCVQLISSGHGELNASFIDASANGSDAFFRTDASLAFGDPGSFDLYDAREGGGFPAPPNAIPCQADACQPLPEAPEDPTPGTLVANAGNPATRFTKVRSPRRHGQKRKGHRHKGAQQKHGSHR